MTLGEGGPGVSVSGSHDRASRSTAATAYDDAKGWHTTSGTRTQSGSGSGNVGTTAGYGIVGGSGAGFSYEFSLNSTSGPSGTSSTSGSASATLSWSGTGDTGQTGGGITARARYDDGEGWQIVSVGPATAAGSEGVPGAGDLGTAAAGDDATFSGDESSRQGQAAANGKGDTAAGDAPQRPWWDPNRSWWEWFWGKPKSLWDLPTANTLRAGDRGTATGGPAAGAFQHGGRQVNELLDGVTTDLSLAAAGAAVAARGAAGAVANAPKLTQQQSGLLRRNATDIWEKVAGTRASWKDLQVHHRIPLEWSHLFPKANPNRVSNLVGIDGKIHPKVTAAWAEWKRLLGGRTPTQAEIMEQALKIDEIFKDHWVFPK